MQNLASYYSNLSGYEDAKKLGKKMFDVRKRILGEEHPHTLQSMRNLAYYCRILSRTTEAMHLMKSVDALEY